MGGYSFAAREQEEDVQARARYQAWLKQGGSPEGIILSIWWLLEDLRDASNVSHSWESYYHEGTKTALKVKKLLAGIFAPSAEELAKQEKQALIDENAKLKEELAKIKLDLKRWP